MHPGLPPRLDVGDLPPHPRGPWVRDFHSPSPDGAHVVTIYGYDETSMGYYHGRAHWAAAKTPWMALGALPNLPVTDFAHWIDDRRFALKVHVHHGHWVRPLVVIDLDGTFAVLPHSSGETPDVPRLSDPIDASFQPFSPAALAVALDLIHLS